MKSATSNDIPWLFVGTIFLSAFLLFSLEPLIAKRIVPWFGGSAAVWSTCLVFYQVALLAGYLYAALLRRYLRPVVQSAVHLCVLVASLLMLPIGPGLRWKPVAMEHPSSLILFMLTGSIGLPFIALSATSPLLQSWLARRGSRTPYRLFAVSNFASLAALLAYPTIVEPSLDTGSQSLWWSVLYVVFFALCLAATFQTSRFGLQHAIREQPVESLSKLRIFEWFALSACSSMLLLSVTNHIDENIAAVPLMWVLPLAIYLATFVFSFGALNIYRRSLWLRLLAFALGILGYAIYNIDAIEAIQVSLPVFLSGLFISCLFCHGELNRLRPPTPHLTSFYLAIAAGGAAGSIFVGLIAPQIFNGIYELPLSLVFIAALALGLTWNDGVWAFRLLWTGVAGCMLIVMVMNVKAYRANALSLRRSFYGSLRVVQTAHAGPDQQRILFHGTIEHGAEYLQPPRRSRPITYYGLDSGVAILLRECVSSPKRVGVIGLGTGTLAAFGQPGDEFRFFEINPQVAEIAQSLFFYLRESAAKIGIVLGDGRLMLERDSSKPFDVLVIDAFSGDAIPVHLLTKEAINLYLRRLRSNGALAIHVSNVFLDLAPVVQQLARDAGLKSVLVHQHRDDEDSILPSDWVLVTNNSAVLGNAAIRLHSQPIRERAALRIWTDSYNNLFQVFKAPELHR